MSTSDIVSALIPVVDCLDELGVAYVICGSLSSVAHGIPRATHDIDLVADIESTQATALVRNISTRYYVDEEAAHEAVKLASSFNAIYLETMFKVDIFVSKPTVYDAQVLQRAQLLPLSEGPDARLFKMQTPEDTILTKLRWYRIGREISERQISDVLGVMRVQAQDLDFQYLRRWADELGVRDLLDACLQRSGIASA